MSVFGSIMSKIYNAAESAVGNLSHPSQTAAPADAAPAAAAPPASPATASSPVSPASPATQPVDVEAVLSAMASRSGGGGNWRTSIVDLLKLLDLDSSLAARKQLAAELNIHAGEDGSAEENIALHKGVMQKLAENGGKVPESMKG